MLKDTAEGIKETVKDAISSPEPQKTHLVFLGAVLSPPVAAIYSFLYNLTMGRLPIPPILNHVIKILTPAVPIAIIKYAKLPAGNIVNGALLGVVVFQIVELILSLVSGEGFQEENKMEVGDALSVRGDEFFGKLNNML